MMRRSLLLVAALIFDIALTSVAVVFYPSPNGVVKREDGYLFTFAQIADTHLPDSRAINDRVINWLASQENISFVVHTGDIVDRPFVRAGWEAAYELMHKLGNKTLWAVLAGNHDVAFGQLDLTNYLKYFGNDSIDQYFIIENKILFIVLSWDNMDGGVSHNRLEWMDMIIDSHEELTVVVCLHPHLFGLTLLNIFGAPNYEEIWSHLEKHENVALVLCGHIHLNWVLIRGNDQIDIWTVSTEATKDRGYIRLFDVYEDKIEVYAYSPWTNQTYLGALDRFTVKLRANVYDVDGDLWRNTLDPMPTHPLMPNIMFISFTAAITILAYWFRDRRNSNSLITKNIGELDSQVHN